MNFFVSIYKHELREITRRYLSYMLIFSFLGLSHIIFGEFGPNSVITYYIFLGIILIKIVTFLAGLIHIIFWYLNLGMLYYNLYPFFKIFFYIGVSMIIPLWEVGPVFVLKGDIQLLKIDKALITAKAEADDLLLYTQTLNNHTPRHPFLINDFRYNGAFWILNHHSDYYLKDLYKYWTMDKWSEAHPKENLLRENPKWDCLRKRPHKRNRLFLDYQNSYLIKNGKDIEKAFKEIDRKFVYAQKKLIFTLWKKKSLNIHINSLHAGASWFYPSREFVSFKKQLSEINLITEKSLYEFSSFKVYWNRISTDTRRLIKIARWATLTDIKVTPPTAMELIQKYSSR